MKIGYARVSTEEQNLDLQRQALTAASGSGRSTGWAGYCGFGRLLTMEE